MYYTEDTFQMSRTRAKAIREYLHVLRDMYEKQQGKLIQDGLIIKCQGRPEWEKVVAQAPKFFEQRHAALKGTNGSTVGVYVMQQLHKVVMDVKVFPTLLRDIFNSGVLVLSNAA